MTHRMSYTKKILGLFLHKDLTPIVGLPAFETISTDNLELNACADSAHSYRGNGKLGLLFLAFQSEVLDENSSVKFTPHANPGQNPTKPETTSVHKSLASVVITTKISMSAHNMT